MKENKELIINIKKIEEQRNFDRGAIEPLR